MLVERGRVSKVRSGHAVVAVERPDACHSCAARGACMVLGSTSRRIEVLDPLGASVGDEVEIGLPATRVVWASAVAYLMPVLAMFVGALVGLRLGGPGHGDVAAAAGAFSGLGLAALGVWLHGRAAARNTEAMARVVRILSAGASRPSGVDTDCTVG